MKPARLSDGFPWVSLQHHERKTVLITLWPFSEAEIVGTLLADILAKGAEGLAGCWEENEVCQSQSKLLDFHNTTWSWTRLCKETLVGKELKNCWNCSMPLCAVHRLHMATLESTFLSNLGALGPRTWCFPEPLMAVKHVVLCWTLSRSRVRLDMTWSEMHETCNNSMLELQCQIQSETTQTAKSCTAYLAQN